MPKFYLNQLRDVENDADVAANLSATTVALCLAALLPAEERDNWIQDLEPLDDTEWSEAEQFLWTAIEELTGATTGGPALP